MVSQASLAPHLEHLSRRSVARRSPDPPALTISVPVSVLDAPQLPQLSFTLARNRTRSAAAVLTCFVLTGPSYERENDSGTDKT